MWKRSLLVFLFSLSVQEAKDHETQDKNKQCLPPLLLNSTTEVTKGQQVTLLCLLAWESPQNKSLNITYYLFRNQKRLKTKKTAGEAAMFNISVSAASNVGPYKCKAQMSNCTKYSPAHSFTLVGHTRCPLCPHFLFPATLLPLLAVTLILALWIRPKCKARKAKEENALRVCEKEAKEAVIYTSVRVKHAEAGSGPGSGLRPCVPASGEEAAQEAHYATSLLPDVAPGGRDGDPCKTDLVYCELTW